ncbi:aldehyde dehydrogenase (NADP(+)) [uncultured Pelagimonas sp.]|uniref:aldehyde dehydrogenase (NADP(+)) n=1 Tax=uncultured Pelagimonas sp. TaxID=1618102 RepID=UPI00262E13B8|nr:aldehyde dehydrogenase (NADP(+)) [uncultured Pelagimonas sp.]
MLKSKHLVSGEWIDTTAHFSNQPVSGKPDAFAVADPDLVDQAVQAAERAFWSYGYSSRIDRAAFLRQIAVEIDLRGDLITEMGCKETGLPHARLIGERGRTTGQLNLFAEHIEEGNYLDRRHDVALPDRSPAPRPDLRMVQRAIGPVAVFGASNFPLAFSTAGGDTAAALAAGCPVVVKGHPAHPGTSDIVAQAIDAAIKHCGIDAGVFSLIQGDGFIAGQALVQHPLIRAVGFTGSLRGGRALFDLCAARPDPIPFFGELGSINPMFVLPAALGHRGAEIAAGWAGSLTIGAGQFCTNPGLVVLIDGVEAQDFVASAKAALKDTSPQVMLTDGIAAAFVQGGAEIAAQNGVQKVLMDGGETRRATPQLFATTAKEWLANDKLSEEVFGPLGLVVLAETADEMMAVAKGLKGQLTCTLHLDDSDISIAKNLMPILERKAGRVLANGFPTGVEVSDAMVHGGPYPASTNFGATSVGTLSIRRFLRPVCYQNIPDSLLGAD